MKTAFFKPSPVFLPISQQAACLHQNYTIRALKHNKDFYHHLKWQQNSNQVMLLTIYVLMCDMLCRNPMLPYPDKQQQLRCSAPDVLEPAELDLPLRQTIITSIVGS